MKIFFSATRELKTFTLLHPDYPSRFRFLVSNESQDVPNDIAALLINDHPENFGKTLKAIGKARGNETELTALRKAAIDKKNADDAIKQAKHAEEQERLAKEEQERLDKEAATKKPDEETDKDSKPETVEDIESTESESEESESEETQEEETETDTEQNNDSSAKETDTTDAQDEKSGGKKGGR